MMSLLASKVAFRVRLASRPKLPTLWWENEAGDRWRAPEDDPFAAPPDGYIYQHSRFPGVLRTNILRMVQQAEVDACPHPVEAIKPDLGLIEGLEGRECSQCHGTQTKDAGAPWPLKWEAYGSRQFMAFESSWPDELVLAMVRPAYNEMKLALERFVGEPRLLELDDAIILAATSCERCLNGLLWRYGCDDGYPPYSPEWDKCNTKCAICETPGVWDWLLNKPVKTAAAWSIPGDSKCLECPTKPIYDEGRDAYACPATGAHAENGPYGEVGPVRMAMKTAASQHYRKLCSVCGTVIEQCRCMSPDKVTLYGVCDACSGKPKSDRFDFSPEILARLQTVLLTDDELATRTASRYLEAKPSPHQRGWEKRKEKDDFTEQNIPPEHLLLWRKVKNQFKGTPDERATRFMEWLEEHPGESDAVLQERANKDVSKLVREQEKERREQVKVEKECDKNQTKYENAWYAEQARATKEKAKLKQLKELADGVCQSCPTCHQYGPEEEREMVPFAASLHVAARFMAASQIRWVRTPGRAAELASSPGGGIYAMSADKRFLVAVHRYMTGDKGRRQYLIYFTAVDYGTPSGGQRYTDVPIRATEKSDPKKTMAAVERWAAEHPLEGQ